MEPHELDVVSLTAGLIFVAIGVGHLLGMNVIHVFDPVGALWPLLIVVGGVVLLRLARRTNGR